MLQRLLNLPLAVKAASFAAAICLLTSLLLISAGHSAYRTLLREQVDSFGLLLVNQFARNAAVPLLQQDLVSLQAMLARWVQQPMISSAIVYDLEQRIVAAAGVTPDPNRHWDYSTEITWEDSSSGRIVIAIDPTPMLSATRGLALQLLLLALLLTTLAYAITVVPGRHLDQLLVALRLRLQQGGTKPQQRYPGRDSLSDLIHTIEEPLAGVPTEESTPVASPEVLLHLSFALDAQAEHCLRWLRAACRLYDAQPMVSRSNGLSALFHGESDDAAFRAVCCAVLLANLCRDQQPRIGVAIMEAEDDSLGLQRRIESLVSQLTEYEDHALWLDPQIAQCEWASARMQTAHEGPLLRLALVQEPYAGLLRKQADSLREQLET